MDGTDEVLCCLLSARGEDAWPLGEHITLSRQLWVVPAFEMELALEDCAQLKNADTCFRLVQLLGLRVWH